MPDAKYATPQRLSSCFRKSDYLKPGDIALLLPWSRTTIDNMIRAGELPAPDLVRNKIRYWRKSVMLPAIRAILNAEVTQ